MSDQVEPPVSLPEYVETTVKPTAARWRAQGHERYSAELLAAFGQTTGDEER